MIPAEKDQQYFIDQHCKWRYAVDYGDDVENLVGIATMQKIMLMVGRGLITIADGGEHGLPHTARVENINDDICVVTITHPMSINYVVIECYLRECLANWMKHGPWRNGDLRHLSRKINTSFDEIINNAYSQMSTNASIAHGIRTKQENE